MNRASTTNLPGEESVWSRQSLDDTADARARIPVSSASRWGDAKWILDVTTPGCSATNRTINWHRRLPNGRYLTEPEYSELLEASKRFVWSLRTQPALGRPYSFGSLVKMGERSMQLIDWMIDRGLATFGALDNAVCESYAEHVLAQPLRPSGRQAKINVLIQLYQQRAHLPAEHRVPTAPFGGRSAHEIADVGNAEDMPIPHIPDAVAVHLIGSALTWVEQYAETIIHAADTYRAAYYATLDRGQCGESANLHARKALRSLKLTLPVLRDPSDPTRMQPRRRDHRVASPMVQGIPTSGHDLTHLLTGLRSACYIVIGAFTGMRVHEILGLEIGCVERSITREGDELLFLRGKTWKTAPGDGARAARWVAPEPVAAAVSILERLSAPLRARTGRPHLFLTTRHIIFNTGPCTLTSSRSVVRLMNEFAALTGAPPHEGQPWKLSTHQLRKTFARYVGWQDRSSLLALADHFKHVSTAMTEGYVLPDDEVLRWIVEYQSLEQADAVQMIASSRGLAGKKGVAVHVGRKQYRWRGRLDDRNLEDVILHLIRTTELTIVMHPYGFCAYDAETAKCGGDRACMGRNVCVSCPNFVVTDQHRPFWTELLRRNEWLLGLLELEGANPLRCVDVVQQLEEARRILAELEETANDVECLTA